MYLNLQCIAFSHTHLTAHFSVQFYFSLPFFPISLITVPHSTKLTALSFLTFPLNSTPNIFHVSILSSPFPHSFLFFPSSPQITSHPPPTLASSALSLTIAFMASELLGLSRDFRRRREDLVESSKLRDRLATLPPSPFALSATFPSSSST